MGQRVEAPGQAPLGRRVADTLRFRDAARDAPGPSCHKPKTPVGRRGVSLTHTAD